MYTDSITKPTEFLYEYDPETGFDYNLFLKLSTPAMYEYLEDLKAEEITIDDVPVIVNIDDVDYGNEFDDMFRRMQIDRLHGRTGFVFDRPMTYIDAPVAYTYKDHKGRDEEQIGTLPINVVGRVYIFPKGIRIVT